MMKIKISIIVLFLIVFGVGLYAQQSISSSGGEATGSGGTLSYTVGQLVYTSINSINGSSLSLGVQQTYSVSVTTELKNNLNISLKCSIFPNPTTNYLRLKIENMEIKNLSYQLYNIKGQMLKTNPLESIETNINISQLQSSNYLLKVIQNNQVVKSFNIIKN